MKGDLPQPILFLARGHSGTRALAYFMEQAGVYMGTTRDPYNLNSTYDSLYWTYGFQRYLVPKLFQSGQGFRSDDRLIEQVGEDCVRRHLAYYKKGPWGFKTCEGMFAHPMYRHIFPSAKYIYLIRDGRDVIISGDGYLTLTNPSSRYQHWDYFLLITFGVQNDKNDCPFPFPENPEPGDSVMQNRFWVQAKSWREHVRMVEYLRITKILSDQVYTIKYEDLCHYPIEQLKSLFLFLELNWTEKLEKTAKNIFHTQSIGRWKHYKKYIGNHSENMDAVFQSMEPELRLLKYL